MTYTCLVTVSALSVLLLSGSCTTTKESAPRSGATAFEQLTSLVGSWEGAFPDGRKHTVSYRLTAADSVLVETWTLGPNRESMTLYSTDGSNLIATHFCPQGNQPRLRLVQGNDPAKLSFEFLDGINLQVEGKEHQHAFWLRIDSPNSFTRSETYVKNNSTASGIAATSPEEAITYTRTDSVNKTP
jgi:hypothetical protein